MRLQTFKNSAFTGLLVLNSIEDAYAYSTVHRVLTPSRLKKFVPLTSSIGSVTTRTDVSLRGNLSPLFSSATSPHENNNQDPSRKRDAALAVLRRVIAKASLIKASIFTAVRIVYQNSKIKTATICLIYFLLLGNIATDTVGSFTNSRPSTRETPIEVPFSRYMDYCEGRDTNSKARLVHVDNVKVARETMEYRVLYAETRSQRHVLMSLKQGIEVSEEILSEIPQNYAYTHNVDMNSDVINFMRKNKVTFQANSNAGTARRKTDEGLATAGIMFLAYRMYKNNPTSSSKGPGKMAKTKGGAPLASFDDIEGIDDAKHDVMELVDTLRNPEKYSIVGARPPTGLLLEGPPGTGKTTLARATAAMAGVPMIHCSGSEFVEMYVGNGAARVRKLFAEAEKVKGPSLIFIDEIDALGKARSEGGNGNRDEAEQTLNQLLACMDGLDSGSQICVLGATNRKEVLDPALVRPGRFDRIIRVDLPSEEGRERILRVHADKLGGFNEGRGVDKTRENSLGRGESVDLSAVAAITDGLSGAELECIVNEAAIRAVRRVSIQLNEGLDKSQVDNKVYAEDFEASVASFFESRKGKKKSKKFGIIVPSRDDASNFQKARPNKIFTTASTAS